MQRSGGAVCRSDWLPDEGGVGAAGRWGRKELTTEIGIPNIKEVEAVGQRGNELPTFGTALQESVIPKGSTEEGRRTEKRAAAVREGWPIVAI